MQVIKSKQIKVDREQTLLINDISTINIINKMTENKKIVYATFR